MWPEHGLLPHSGALFPPVALIDGRERTLCVYIGARYTWHALSLFLFRSSVVVAVVRSGVVKPHAMLARASSLPPQ